MKRTKLASILAAAFIFGGSTVLGATSPSIYLKSNPDKTVTVEIKDLAARIYGIQLELETKEALDPNKEIQFKSANSNTYSFTVIKGNTLTLYVASSQILNSKEGSLILGDLVDITGQQFDTNKIAKYKVVDYFFAPMDETDIGTEIEGSLEEKPETNPEEKPETKPEEVPDTSYDDEDESTGNSGSVQKPSEPQKPVEPEKPVQPEDSTESEKPSAPVVEFNDTKNHWAGASINKMASLGILKGYEDGSFGPSKQITRAEFAAVVARALGFNDSVDSLPFKDTVSGKWYTDSIGNLYQKGIITGRPDGTFGVNDSINNQEIAVMISRALKVLEVDLEEQRSYEGFKDATSISAFAQEAVKELYELGIISGMPDGSYQPKASSTRAQVAVIVDRILTMMQAK